MTMLTNVHRLVDRRETVGTDPDMNFATLAPVLLMSSIGLTLSLLIITLVAR
jgi:hypothetical protein